MDVLGKIFGSSSRVKIMRLFVLNPDFALKTSEVAKWVKSSTQAASRELSGLSKAGLVHKVGKGGGGALTWQLDKGFPFITALRNLLKNNLIGYRKDLAKKIAACGKLQVLILSGIFIADEVEEDRADIVIVGNNMKKGSIDQVIKKFEAEIGKELNYAVLDTADFKYRLNACDKFIRDLLDYPHEVVVDKIGI